MKKVGNIAIISRKEFNQIMVDNVNMVPTYILLEGIAEESVLQGIENIEDVTRVLIEIEKEEVNSEN